MGMGNSQPQTASLAISATPDRVYQAMTRSDEVVKWLPPAGAKATIHTFEPRAGGAIRLTLEFKEGSGKSAQNKDEVVGRFVELVPGLRVIQAFTFDSDKPEFAGEMRMVWELLGETDHRTRVTVTATDVPRGISRTEHEAGMASSLQNLKDHLGHCATAPTITAFRESPDQGQGQARDMRVRWALEEVHQPYEVRLVSLREMKEPEHLGIQPFGQIPTYEEGELQLFESGAIVLHIANRHAGLLSGEFDARARAITWMFSALNTVEPPLVELEAAKLIEHDRPWYVQRLPLLQERAHARLDSLSRRLGDAEWLDGNFSAGDLMMIGVLFRTRDLGLLERYSNLRDYVSRGESRPAFQRAFAAQRAVLTASQRA